MIIYFDASILTIKLGIQNVIDVNLSIVFCFSVHTYIWGEESSDKNEQVVKGMVC